MQDDYIINKVKIHKKLSGKITKMQISDVKDKKRTHAYTAPPNTHTHIHTDKRRCICCSYMKNYNINYYYAPEEKQKIIAHTHCRAGESGT